MKIKTLHLKGWGVFPNEEKTLHFSPTTNVIYGMNEAGKSTIRTAIQELFFGFPYKNFAQHPYIGRGNTEIMIGGDIEFKGQNYHVERILKTSEKSMQFDGYGVQDISAKPILILNGLSRNIYKGIFEMELSDLLALSIDQWENIKGHINLQYGADIISSPKDILDDMNSEMHGIWRPHRRGNFVIKDLDARLQNLYRQRNQIKIEREDFLMELDGAEDIRTQYDDIEKSIEQLKNKKAYYQDNWSVWTLIKEIESLKKQTEETSMPKITMTKREFSNLRNEINTCQQKKIEIDNRIVDLRSRLSEYEDDQHNKNHQNDLLAVDNNFDDEEEVNYDMFNKDDAVHEYNNDISEEEYYAFEGKVEMYHKEVYDQSKRSTQLTRWQQELSRDVNTIAKTTWFETAKDWANIDVDEVQKQLDNRTKILSKDYYWLLIIGLTVLGVSIYALKPLELYIGIAVSMVLILLFFARVSKKKQIGELSYNKIVFFENANMSDDEFIIFCQDISQRSTSYMQTAKNAGVQRDRIAELSHVLMEKMDEFRVPYHYDLEERLKLYEQMRIHQKNGVKFYMPSSSMNLKNKAQDIPDEYSQRKQILQKFKREGNIDVEKLRTIERDKESLRRLVVESGGIQYKLLRKQSEYEAVESALLTFADDVDAAFEMMAMYGDMENRLNGLIAHKNALGLSEKALEHLSHIDDLSEVIQNIDKKIDAQMETRQSLKVNLATITNSEKEQEFGKKYNDVLGEIEQVREDRVMAIAKYNHLKMISELISYADAKFSEVYQPKIFDIASFWLSQFTQGKYTKIVVDDAGNFMMFNTREHRHIPVTDALSRGTLEQLYMSMRLALAQSVEENDIMPLVLDEVFVNWDINRTHSAAKVMFGGDEDRQIFYFTCHKLMADILEKQYGAYRIDL